MCIVEPYKMYDWERLVNRSQIFRWNVISKFRKSSVSSTGFFFARTSIWLFQDRFSSTSMPRYAKDFATVSKYSLSLMLHNIKFSLLIGIKSRHFVLDSYRESLFALS